MIRGIFIQSLFVFNVVFVFDFLIICIGKWRVTFFKHLWSGTYLIRLSCFFNTMFSILKRNLAPYTQVGDHLWQCSAEMYVHIEKPSRQEVARRSSLQQLLLLLLLKHNSIITHPGRGQRDSFAALIYSSNQSRPCFSDVQAIMRSLTGRTEKHWLTTDCTTSCTDWK